MIKSLPVPDIFVKGSTMVAALDIMRFQLSFVSLKEDNNQHLIQSTIKN